MCTSVTSLRVISHAPKVITTINPQVVTMVLLSSRKPYRQKTSSSGVRRNAGLLFQRTLLFRRRVREPPHVNDSRDQKSNKACHEPRPVTLRNKIESSQN